MAETPKRSLGESIGQLVAILVLVAVLIGAIVLLRQFLDSHGSSQQGASAPSGLVLAVHRSSREAPTDESTIESFINARTA